MTTENLESVIRRVQKLLAIAEHERSDPNEAAAAAGMAEKIMRKYQLDYSAVIITALKRGDDLSTEDIVCSAKTNGTKTLVVAPWIGYLAVAIARLNECHTKQGWTPNGEACVRFMGYTADVQLSRWTLDYLVQTTNRLCNEYKKTDDYARGGRRLLNGYRHGVSIGMVRSLGKLEQAKKAEMAEAAKASTGTSLMVVKQEAIVAKFGDFTTRTGKTSVTRGDSFVKGVRDGAAVDVGRRAVGGAGSTALLK
jgi:hypothetical protein